MIDQIRPDTQVKWCEQTSQSNCIKIIIKRYKQQTLASLEQFINTNWVRAILRKKAWDNERICDYWDNVTPYKMKTDNWPILDRNKSRFSSNLYCFANFLKETKRIIGLRKISLR